MLAIRTRGAANDDRAMGAFIDECLAAVPGRGLRLVVRRQPRSAGEQRAIVDPDGWSLHAIITSSDTRERGAVEAHHRLRGGIRRGHHSRVEERLRHDPRTRASAQSWSHTCTDDHRWVVAALQAGAREHLTNAGAAEVEAVIGSTADGQDRLAPPCSDACSNAEVRRVLSPSPRAGCLNRCH